MQLVTKGRHTVVLCVVVVVGGNASVKAGLVAYVGLVAGVGLVACGGVVAAVADFADLGVIGLECVELN